MNNSGIAVLAGKAAVRNAKDPHEFCQSDLKCDYATFQFGKILTANMCPRMMSSELGCPVKIMLGIRQMNASDTQLETRLMSWYCLLIFFEGILLATYHLQFYLYVLTVVVSIHLRTCSTQSWRTLYMYQNSPCRWPCIITCCSSL